MRKDGRINDSDDLYDGPEDVYIFDIGYNIAFNQIIYTIGCVYSIICPPVLLICGIYFAHKWLVDTYTLTVRYPKEYEGKGEISNQIAYLLNITIVV